MERLRVPAITIYLLQFIGMLVFASELRAQVTQIQVNIVTPDISGAGTDASIFLGIGGREFTLDQRNRNDFERNSENTFIFGENSNVARPADNDPRTDPPLTEEEVDRFPVYIRMSDVGDQLQPFDFPEDEWTVDFILVNVFSGGLSRSFTSPRLGVPDDGRIQRVGPRSGHILFLQQPSAPRAQVITRLQMTIVTPDMSGAGTDASIFLGIGGREFTLDVPNRNDFERNSRSQFILGENSNVARPADNDPRTDPPLTEEEVDRFPVYIRMSDVGDQLQPFDFPEDEWTVDFIDVSAFSGGLLVREFFSPRLGLENDGRIQRVGPRSGHILFLQQPSAPGVPITGIQVNIVTPDISGAGTDASIFLGIGGREFTLDVPNRNDFERNSRSQFILGENSNVARPADNDPRTDPPLTEEEVDRFPVYIRMSDVGDQLEPFDFPEDEWTVDFIDVSVFSAGRRRSFTSPRLGVTDRRIQRVGPQSGHILFLQQLSVPLLPTSGSEPPFEPEKWNFDGSSRDLADAQFDNNCYNYACNKRTDTFAQPGRAGGMPLPRRYTCMDLTRAALADGLRPFDCDQACPAGSYKKALVLDPDDPIRDYHWYRQDEDGTWSHKPGGTKATNVDASGRRILDPRTADRAVPDDPRISYRDFCGCFCCSPDEVVKR